MTPFGRSAYWVAVAGILLVALVRAIAGRPVPIWFTMALLAVTIIGVVAEATR